MPIINHENHWYSTSGAHLLNCHQKPAFHPLNLVFSISAAMFITTRVTVCSAPQAQCINTCSYHPQSIHPFRNI